MTKEKTKDVELYNPDNFAVMKKDPNTIKALILSNFGNETINARDLPQITVPSRGGTMWTIYTADGEVQVEEVVGIILWSQVQRRYWKESFEDTGGGTPPDCSSDDGFQGHGNPGGDCVYCPLAQFGSDERGRAQACAQRRVVFILMPDRVLPAVVNVPPTSLDSAKKYIVALTNELLLTSQVVTAMTLVGDRNKKGVEYSKIEFRRVANVTDQEVVDAYAQTFRPSFEAAAEQMMKEERQSN